MIIQLIISFIILVYLIYRLKQSKKKELHFLSNLIIIFIITNIILININGLQLYKI